MIATILDTIGRTPLITCPNTNQADAEGQLLLKYERYNPGGSVKDRPALYMVREAERRGLLRPGGTIIESSSGNFGISLAMIGAARGYRVIILVDPKTTAANVALLKAFGAEVVVVTEQDDSGSYHKTRITEANRLARDIEHSFRPDQCFNLLNSEAHYASTARELLEALGDRLAVFVAAVSTGGQLGGVSRYLKTFAPHVRVIGVDAVGSTVFGGEAHSYRIPGVGLSWTPANLDVELLDSVYKVADGDAFIAARAFARNEGILMGPSSGACALVGMKLAQQLAPGQCVVSMVADGGDRYLPTLFNDEWMESQGLAGDLSAPELRLQAQRLRPWSERPAECANYRHDLTELLDVPATTLRLNAEMRQEDDRRTG